MTRVRALIGKELLDLRRNRAALAPVVIVVVMSLVLPFLIVIGIPLLTGESLGREPDLVKVSDVGASAASASLTPEGRIQVFLFQQFLLLFLLTPVTGAMALAAHSVVGEKQGRTLEPLLATPITAVELLVAKVLGALLPTLTISLAGILFYFAGIVALAAPGVAWAMASGRSALLVLLVGPGAALVSLQSALLISSRVNDARAAQQFGVLIIIPLTVLLVAQFLGSMWLSNAALALIGAGLFGIWIVLTLVSAALFEREAILTRWR